MTDWPSVVLLSVLRNNLDRSLWGDCVAPFLAKLSAAVPSDTLKLRVPKAQQPATPSTLIIRSRSLGLNPSHILSQQRQTESTFNLVACIPSC